MPKAEFRFTGSLHGFKFDLGGFTKKYEAAAEKLVRDAAKEWLRAVLISVPIWTGFAQGSIVFAKGPGGWDLARYLGMVGETRVPHDHDTPKWHWNQDGSKVRKIPENGGRFGRFNFPIGQHRFRFRYTNSLLYFHIESFYGNISPTSPWFAMQHGRDAFAKFVNQNKARLPKASRFLQKYDIKEF